MSHVMVHPHRGIHRSDINTEVREHAVIDRDLQRRKYGGFHFYNAVAGWLVSMGIASILVAILAAAGSAVAITTATTANSVSSQTAATVGIVSGILLVVVLALAYLAGGYVAGRMARFDGARQGFGVWLVGFVVMILLGIVGAAAGAKYNVLQQLNLPHLPVKTSSYTTGGLVTSVAALLATLLTAIVGGKMGERYHRKIDDMGTIGTTTTQ